MPVWISFVFVYGFTLYAPYVAMPHIRIISRDIAVAMQISVEREHKWNNTKTDHLDYQSSTAVNMSFH